LFFENKLRFILKFVGNLSTVLLGEKGGRSIVNDLNIFQSIGIGRRAEVNEVLK